MKAGLAAVTLAASIALGISSARAALITDVFSFFDSGNAVIASGSFSYDSSNSGQLTYAQLSSFSISFPAPNAQSFDLAFINSLTPATDYVYFGYNTVSNSFIPASVPGGTAPASGILAGGHWSAGGNGIDNGFFIDPLVSQLDPGNPDADGIVAQYLPDNPTAVETLLVEGTAASVVVTAVPELSSWEMMVLGFCGLGLIACRRKNLIAALPSEFAIRN